MYSYSYTVILATHIITSVITSTATSTTDNRPRLSLFGT